MKRKASSAIPSFEAIARMVIIATTSVRKPVPVGQDFLQKYDEARSVESKAQIKPKLLPEEALEFLQLLILELDTDVSQIFCNATQISEDCYVMVDSGTNATLCLCIQTCAQMLLSVRFRVLWCMDLTSKP